MSYPNGAADSRGNCASANDDASVGSRAESVTDPTIINQHASYRRQANPLASLTQHARGPQTDRRMHVHRAIAARLLRNRAHCRGQVTQIFLKLRLPESVDQHRRALAVIAVLCA